MMKRLARLRVPLGFACFAVAYWLRTPTRTSMLVGMSIAVAGEAIRSVGVRPQSPRAGK
jgi:hypothetical protein